jgi:putative peptidoglycan lipid II flippase
VRSRWPRPCARGSIAGSVASRTSSHCASAAAFLLIGGVLAAGLFEGGQFTRADAQWVWGALAGAAVGLLASTMGRLYASASYALGDARTPLRFAIVRVALGAVLGWSAALWLPGALSIDARWGVAFLTAASGVAAWVEYVLLRRALSARVGTGGVPSRRLAALWACALAAGPAGVALFGAVYLGATRLAKVDDARRT